MHDGKTDEYLNQAMSALDDPAWAAFADDAGAAHRRGDLDLTSVLAGELGCRVGYATQQFVEKAVAASGLGLDGLLALATAGALREKDSETPYWMKSAIGQWGELDQGNPARLLGAIRDARASIDLVYVAIATGIKVDRPRFLPVVTGMLEGPDAAESDVAANVLGQISDLSPADLATASDALQATLRAAHGERVGAPLRALLDIAVRDASSAAIGIDALTEVSARADRHVRAAITNSMMFGAKKADPALAKPALALLHETAADETGTLEGIDCILSENLSGPLADDIAALADRLLGDETVTMKRLDSYEHQLLTDTGGALVQTVTRWLLADQMPLYTAVRDMCLAVYGNPMTFSLDFSSAALSPQRAVRIARRSCAILFLSPETAASVIVSLMRTGPREAIPALGAILWTPLLISYWSGPRKYLEAVQGDLPDAAADAVRDAIARLDRYSADIEKARDLPELRPSPHHRHLGAIKRHRDQLAIQKSAQEASVFGSVFPTSIMMFGDSTVYDMVVEPGKAIRQESQLGVQEHSHELPRLDVIDPFGTWYRRARMISDGDGK
jgi:hypothetical protein